MIMVESGSRVMKALEIQEETRAELYRYLNMNPGAVIRYNGTRPPLRKYTAVTLNDEERRRQKEIPARPTMEILAPFLSIRS